ncbi:uncharacterized protein LOC108303073 [Cebus imitator]|uniref:uncharacterized protein LOC108303073 n=1 Tax=Cebus imitator TaxID=2715852 RepID=UPI000809AD7A|nr:uncharacterized protein LOC108303073 [Cebus imitator]
MSNGQLEQGHLSSPCSLHTAGHSCGSSGHHQLQSHLSHSGNHTGLCKTHPFSQCLSITEFQGKAQACLNPSPQEKIPPPLEPPLSEEEFHALPDVMQNVTRVSALGEARHSSNHRHPGLFPGCRFSVIPKRTNNRRAVFGSKTNARRSTNHLETQREHFDSVLWAAPDFCSHLMA